MNDPFKILLYEWLQTAEAKKHDKLLDALAKTKKEPFDLDVCTQYFKEVARYTEFKDFQRVMYELLK